MKRALAVVALLLALSKPAMAHRLDEYLQATTIDVASDRVQIQLRLAPGVAVVREVLSGVDADADGSISIVEQQAYAQRVLRDVSLMVDGAAVRMRLTSSTFPSIEQMNEGIGEILLKFETDLPRRDVPRVLLLENRHQSRISVYLVNCLVPTDPAIRIAEQARSFDQSIYQLHYTQGTTSGSGDAQAAATTVEPLASRVSPFAGFFRHGVRHILTGYDHLLFVGALILAANTLWDLLKVVSAFTLAHTITLTLAAMGMVHVPGRVVEPLIAGSIVFVAIQNLIRPTAARGWSRVGVAFFFGLFHGLGFGGGLLDAMRDMPGATMGMAILAFSIGVEAGHQCVVLPLFGLLKAVRAARVDTMVRQRMAIAIGRAGSAGIAVMGLYYLCLALLGQG